MQRETSSDYREAKFSVERRVYFFDAGGTLFHMRASVGRLMAEVANGMGGCVNGDEMDRAFERIWRELGAFEKLRMLGEGEEAQEWWTHVVSTTVGATGTRLEDPPAFANALHSRFADPATWMLYDDTLDTLATLRARGRRLGIVSNWGSNLATLCAALGVGRYFDFVLTSAEFGAAKPDARLFHEALRRASVDGKDAVHVGDSVEEDVVGALSAGLSAVLLWRQRRPFPPAMRERSVRVIAQLSELV
jgi:putative hydrolase of the HAD superfamily